MCDFCCRLGVNSSFYQEKCIYATWCVRLAGKEMSQVSFELDGG